MEIKNHRVYYDSVKYWEEKAKLPAPDGIHCIICGGLLPKRRRKYCSDDCFDKWHGEIGNWNILRWNVLKRDHYTCQKCGGKSSSGSGELAVHHIMPIHEGGEEFNPDNCITLCRGCHKYVHSRVGRFLSKNKTLLDYGGG